MSSKQLSWLQLISNLWPTFVLAKLAFHPFPDQIWFWLLCFPALGHLTERKLRPHGTHESLSVQVHCSQRQQCTVSTVLITLETTCSQRVVRWKKEQCPKGSMPRIRAFVIHILLAFLVLRWALLSKPFSTKKIRFRRESALKCCLSHDTTSLVVTVSIHARRQDVRLLRLAYPLALP